MLFSGIPIVEMGTITEVYADTLSIEIIGTNFWTTYYRVMCPPGESEPVKVPIARVGRALASYNPGLFAQLAKLAMIH